MLRVELRFKLSPIDDVAVALPVPAVDVELLHGGGLGAGLPGLLGHVLDDVPVRDELGEGDGIVARGLGLGRQLGVAEEAVQRVVGGDHVPGGVVLGRVAASLRQRGVVVVARHVRHVLGAELQS